MRELLIDAIIQLASDELESKETIIAIAKESETELVERLIGIAEYYKNEATA